MQKEAPVSSDFYVHYLYPKWGWTSAPPIRHGDGTTLSMADGHVEYWKWKGRETIKMPRELWPAGSIFLDLLEDDYEPKTEDGKRGKNVTFYVQDGTYIWFSDCFPGKGTIRLIEGGSPCRYLLIRVMK